MTKIIEFINVSKTVNKKDLIKNFNYIFEDQKNYVLYGSNSSGKTLFFNILLKKEKIKSGIIEICNENFTSFNKEKLMTYRRQIGFVMQKPIMIEQKTIYENLEVPMLFSDIKQKARKEKIDFFLNKLNLIDIKNKYPKNVSLGTKQKISIIRSLITKPKILLLDEPFNNIDTNFIDIILDLIKNFIHPHAITIIATNNQNVLELFENKNIINFPLIF